MTVKLTSKNVVISLYPSASFNSTIDITGTNNFRKRNAPAQRRCLLETGGVHFTDGTSDVNKRDTRLRKLCQVAVRLIKISSIKHLL